MKFFSLKTFLIFGVVVLMLPFILLNVTNADNKVIVYRLFNKDIGTHLYTTSISERDSVSQDAALWNSEGSQYYVYDSQEEGTVAVYRFFNTQNGAHLYTTSEDEKTTIENTLSQFSYEGIKYYVKISAEDGFEGVHRFFNVNTGAHLYTPNESEYNTVSTLTNEWSYEGIVFYVETLTASDLENIQTLSEPEMSLSLSYDETIFGNITEDPLVLDITCYDDTSGKEKLWGFGTGITIENITFPEIMLFFGTCSQFSGAGGIESPDTIEFLFAEQLTTKDGKSVTLFGEKDTSTNRYVLVASYANSAGKDFFSISAGELTESRFNELKEGFKKVIESIEFDV